MRIAYIVKKLLGLHHGIVQKFADPGRKVYTGKKDVKDNPEAVLYKFLQYKNHWPDLGRVPNR